MPGRRTPSLSVFLPQLDDGHTVVDRRGDRVQQVSAVQDAAVRRKVEGQIEGVHGGVTGRWDRSAHVLWDDSEDSGSFRARIELVVAESGRNAGSGALLESLDPGGGMDFDRAPDRASRWQVSPVVRSNR